MLILLFVIFVALYILASVFIDDCDHEFFRFIVQLCTVIGAAISLIALIFVCIGFSKTMVINETIKMYQDENAAIEQQIGTVVKEYMEYEGKTFTELKGESSVTLVSLYPELKSDELVKTQIATYQANNNKLKELKETKINAKVYKWWLYFGK